MRIELRVSMLQRSAAGEHSLFYSSLFKEPNARRDANALLALFLSRTRIYINNKKTRSTKRRRHIVVIFTLCIIKGRHHHHHHHHRFVSPLARAFQVLCSL